MPEEDVKPQKAISYRISTLVTLGRRDIRGVVCLKNSHKLYSHRWLGRPFFFFFLFFLTKDYTARSTFPKGFSAEFQCQGILISAIDRHTHYSLIKQCFKHSTTHTSPHEDARTAHTPHNEFWRLTNKRIQNISLVFYVDYPLKWFILIYWVNKICY